MRRFQFRFEKLLWHRSVQEELAEHQLARTLLQEQQVLTAIAEVRGSAAMGATALRTELETPIDGERLALHRRYASALRIREGQLQERRRALAERLEHDRDALRERRRDREVVSQLKRRAQERYRLDAERDAQKVLDEVASERHLRRDTDGST